MKVKPPTVDVSEVARRGLGVLISEKTGTAVEVASQGILFTRAYTMRSSNKAKARRLWQQILRMVPSSSQAYQKAYKWLNNSAPSYQDEDED